MDDPLAVDIRETFRSFQRPLKLHGPRNGRLADTLEHAAKTSSTFQYETFLGHLARCDAFMVPKSFIRANFNIITETVPAAMKELARLKLGDESICRKSCWFLRRKFQGKREWLVADGRNETKG
ncbi:hypothetical protein VN97_g12842 [Penicillium thymicola]|uniref:Uncharacterized protein n=1 Tax=Penicillium thymicola TaxID=293382 RepID=A0AAI9T5C0_PENTH|nr:hypothetical protein VN97_g12842 [Penicillium thymicola]